ncbi:MAG TPA: PDZ domain-containing protein [Anaeromyxobacteraceae bacterium]|nr:PDZ domain-containing protein [Anaeromyxobacteraceae bacterium]
MRYHLGMSAPHSHLFEVEAELDHPGLAAVLALPVWTPGSYLVREFSRHVEGLAAEDGEGRPLPVVRLDKHRFRIEAGGAGRVRVRYRVYANELTVRTAHLDGRHAFFNGANLFLYAEGRLSEPVELEVVPPAGWHVTTALEGGPGRFHARDYDELADCPVEVGTHDVETFDALGRRHEVALVGRGFLDAPRFLDDLRRVVEHFGALLGGLPYERYVFIVHVADKRRGGLEHERSSTLHVARTGFFPPETYEETLALAAHELFHAWNVKLLRPAALVPYDYEREQYTRLLWWFEGVTSYYDRLSLLRAGVGDPRRYLKHLGEGWTALLRQPGSRKMSLEEASLTAWVKYYRPDENAPNSAVSYYQKGELVALALDLMLRARGSSLDDLLRLLYRRHVPAGLPEDGVERAVGELVGESAARAFFDSHVRGTSPLEAELEAVGLRLGRRAAQSLDDKGGIAGRSADGEPVPGWLGADLAPGPRLVVRSVREDGPAFRAGLYAADEIVAESGFRVDRAGLWDRMRALGAGGRLHLTVFRSDELVAVEVPLEEPPADTVWLEQDPGATQAQREAFRAWTGMPLPGG